ncbi:MAG: 3'-5' exonuclease [Chthoniobacteraceae bacterium]
MMRNPSTLGAAQTFKNILDFPKRYPKAKVYKIETNYRSVPQILRRRECRDHGERESVQKRAAIRAPAIRVKPALVPLGDSNQQAQFVAQRILELRDEGADLREIAVLYRAHYHSMEVQMELTRHGIPFTITSGLRFFEQAHVKDVAAFMKFVVNPRDEVAFKRMARLLPGIGARSARAALERGGAPHVRPAAARLRVRSGTCARCRRLRRR